MLQITTRSKRKLRKTYKVSLKLMIMKQKSSPNLSNKAKAVIREKVTAIQTYIRKKEKR